MALNQPPSHRYATTHLQRLCQRLHVIARCVQPSHRGLSCLSRAVGGRTTGSDGRRRWSGAAGGWSCHCSRG